MFKKLAVLMLLSGPVLACKAGFIPVPDSPGVCQESAATATQEHPEWVSDEKPPKDKMPSYQREGIKVMDAPSTAAEDEKIDAEKRDAEAQGKKAAGVK